MTEKEMLFIIQGYELQTPDGNLMNSCIIEVFADNEKQALEKSKNYIKKPFYRVSKIIEHPERLK